MNRLPQPKEVKEPWTVWNQLKIGIVGYLFCAVTGNVLAEPLIEVCGIWFYAASFSLFPIPPKHMADDQQQIKKFKRTIRVVGIFMCLFSLTKLR